MLVSSRSPASSIARACSSSALTAAWARSRSSAARLAPSSWRSSSCARCSVCSRRWSNRCARCSMSRARRKAADLALRLLDSLRVSASELLEIRDLPVSSFELASAGLDLRALREQLAPRGRTGRVAEACPAAVASSRELGLLGECLARAPSSASSCSARCRDCAAAVRSCSRSPRACATAIALGLGALARRFDFGRQLDDPLLALAEHRAHPFRRGQGLASGALRGLELGARRRKLGLRRHAGGVCLVERLVERSDLARQRLDSRLNLERLLRRGVVIGVVRGRELGLELATLRSRSASCARRFSMSACASAEGSAGLPAASIRRSASPCRRLAFARRAASRSARRAR